MKLQQAIIIRLLLINIVATVSACEHIYIKFRSRERPKVINFPQEGQLPQSEELEVTGIQDGDTITVLRGSLRQRIRICSIDAPEVSRGSLPGQPLGDESKNYLQQIIKQSGNKVTVQRIEQDNYGRSVGEVWVNPGIANQESVNRLLVLNGFARTYPRYLQECPNAEAIKKAEADAQAKKAGVWGDRYSIPPEEFRAQQRLPRGTTVLD